MKSDCPFCSQPEIKARRISANTLVCAFPTNIPIVPGHTLIAPLRHVATYAQLTPKERSAIAAMLERIQKSLTKSFGAKGFNVAWNENEVAGQSVAHFHLHVLPRKKGDSGITKYEPRKFLYRPGSREVSPEAELLKVAATIWKNL